MIMQDLKNEVLQTFQKINLERHLSLQDDCTNKAIKIAKIGPWVC